MSDATPLLIQDVLDDIVIGELDSHRPKRPVDTEDLATMQFIRVEIAPPAPRPRRVPRATPPPLPTRRAPPSADKQGPALRRRDVDTIPYETVDFADNMFAAEIRASRAERARRVTEAEIPPWRDGLSGRLAIAIGASAVAIAAILAIAVAMG